MVILISTCAFGQKQIITGSVVNGNTNEQLPGALIKVLSSDLQVFTNVDGSFEFEALNTDTLMVSFVGYTTQEVPINDRSS
ncbi:MAG: hypothetical protein ACI8XB_002741, partial [Patiriisocius sp.]